MKIEVTRSIDGDLLADEIRSVFPAPAGWCVTQFDQDGQIIGHQAVACWAVMSDGTVEPMTACQLVDLQDNWCEPGWSFREVEFVGEQELLRRLENQNLFRKRKKSC